MCWVGWGGSPGLRKRPGLEGVRMEAAQRFVDPWGREYDEDNNIRLIHYLIN